MSGQIEMWKQRLLTGIALCMVKYYFRQLASDAVGAQRAEELELHAPRRFRAVVGQVYDLALSWTFNRGMWLVDETLQSLGEPVIAAGLPKRADHSLLNEE